MLLKKTLLLWHTLRFLKPIQFYWRMYLWLLSYLPFSHRLPERISINLLPLVPSIPKRQCLLDGDFCFLNERRSCRLPITWQLDAMSKLWRYHLHYFDYLNQIGADESLGLAFINDWIQHNPVAQGDGWEPYPVSLRVVNWIKFLLRHAALDHSHVHESLFLQTRWLAQRPEYHLLGNHLFKNGVALLYAGSYFAGAEAQAWRSQGLKIVMQQLHEQVLPDGGHFERSPLYHLLMLEDVMDCLNIAQAQYWCSQAQLTLLREKISLMWRALAVMRHEDDDIALFNDCALQSAPQPSALACYARALGVELTPLAFFDQQAMLALPDFGLYKLQNAAGRLLFDVGAIGPDYLPGHAHCDTLSYELSLGGHRCLVNSGTYQYAGALRNQFRGTRAHNTLMVDDCEQHEIWATFRVARRGQVIETKLVPLDNGIQVSAAHTGYRRLAGQPLHRRSISCLASAWLIEDRLEGQGRHNIASFIHLHPDVRVIKQSAMQVHLDLRGVGFMLEVLEGTELLLESGEYAPEFGLRQPNLVLVLRKAGICPLRVAYLITREY